MKKIYLSALALSIGTLSFGQVAKQNLNLLRTNVDKTIKSSGLAPQDKGVTVWSDDFSNVGTWVLTNASTPAQDWIYETDPTVIPVITPNPVNFTTAANGYLYIDSDALGAGVTQDISATNATPIDLTGFNNVSLTWEQDYISFQETFTVSVSGNNGATWTDFVIPGGGGQARVYEVKNLNISAVAGNQNQVLVRFNYLGTWDWMWAIDDVSISVTDDNDIEAGAGFYGFGPNLIQYTKIPVLQISDAQFAMNASNVGAIDQTNTVLTASVNAASVATSTPQTVLAGAVDSLFTANVYTPAPAIGVPLTITLDIASDSVDSTPINNTWAFPDVEVSAFEYGHDDNGTPTDGGGYYTGATPAVEDFEAGNYFDIIANDNVYKIDVVVGPGTLAGAIMDVVLYDASGASFVQIDRSAAYIVAAGDIGNVVSIPLPTSPAVTAGTTYFAAVHGWGGVGNEFFYGRSGTSVDNTVGAIGATSLIFYPSMTAPNVGQNFYTTGTPMVRLNLDAGVGIDEATELVSFNVYPNPSKGEFNINLNANLSNNVSLTVKNVVGQTIINRTVAVFGQTKETISLANYSKGIYFLTIDNETVKLIVE